jgi:hypothetical protein
MICVVHAVLLFQQSNCIADAVLLHIFPATWWLKPLLAALTDLMVGGNC